MRRQRRSVMMAEHLPFAKKYNKRMDGLLVVETRKMECELQLRQLQALAETEEVLRKITEKQVRLKMITEEWLVIDDTLDLLQGCSDKACKGKVAQAWQMWDDAQEEQQAELLCRGNYSSFPLYLVSLKETTYLVVFCAG